MYLKAQVCYYMYNKAIDTIKILQDKDQVFYANQILQLTPIKIKQGTVLCNEGCHLDEIFLLLSGCVYRDSVREKKAGLPPHYLIEGTIFGEREVMCDVECNATYTALSDCTILLINKKGFMNLMDHCENFTNDIVKIAREREKTRLTQLMKLKEGQTIEEHNIMPSAEYDIFS